METSHNDETQQLLVLGPCVLFKVTFELSDGRQWPTSADLFHPHPPQPGLIFAGLACNQTPSRSSSRPRREGGGGDPHGGGHQSGPSAPCVIGQLPPRLICCEWRLPLSSPTDEPAVFDSSTREVFADEVSGAGRRWGGGSSSRCCHGKMVPITACTSRL